MGAARLCRAEGNRDLVPVAVSLQTGRRRGAGAGSSHVIPRTSLLDTSWPGGCPAEGTPIRALPQWQQPWGAPTAPTTLPTDGPEAGSATAAVAPHAGTPGIPRQGPWHLSRPQEHFQRAGRQRLPGPGGEQPQARCGGLPCTVSSACASLPSPVQLWPCDFPDVVALRAHHGGACFRASQAAQSSVERCFCPSG